MGVLIGRKYVFAEQRSCFSDTSVSGRREIQGHCSQVWILFLVYSVLFPFLCKFVFSWFSVFICAKWWVWWDFQELSNYFYCWVCFALMLIVYLGMCVWMKVGERVGVLLQYEVFWGMCHQWWMGRGGAVYLWVY